MKTESELLECYAEAYKTRREEALKDYLNDVVHYITPSVECPQEMSRTDFLQRLHERFEKQNEFIPIECVEIKIMTIESTPKDIISANFGKDSLFISLETNQGKIEKITVAEKNTSTLKLKKIILERPDKLFYEYSGKILVMKKNDPRKIIDTILASNYPYEDCTVHSFNPKLIVKLLKEGFCFMSRIDMLRSLCMATAWHHLSRSIIFLDNIHTTRTVKRILNRYELRIDVEFDRIVDNCTVKHNSGWLTPFWFKTVRAIRAMNRKDVTFTSFGLYHNGDLVAGEFGTIIGRVYSSYSGYHDVNNTGTVQMILTAQYLKKHGFAFWDLGVPIPYKSTLGAKTINLDFFTKIWRVHSIEKPQNGNECTPFPVPEKHLTDVELLNILKNAYRYFYVDDLKEYLTDDFHYASQYERIEIENKAEYLLYLSAKLKSIQRTPPPENRLSLQIVYDTFSGKPYLFMCQDKNSSLFVPEIRDGNFTRINVCMPDLFRFSPYPGGPDLATNHFPMSVPA